MFIENARMHGYEARFICEERRADFAEKPQRNIRDGLLSQVFAHFDSLARSFTTFAVKRKTIYAETVSAGINWTRLENCFRIDSPW